MEYLLRQSIGTQDQNSYTISIHFPGSLISPPHFTHLQSLPSNSGEGKSGLLFTSRENELGGRSDSCNSRGGSRGVGRGKLGGNGREGERGSQAGEQILLVVRKRIFLVA